FRFEPLPAGRDRRRLHRPVVVPQTLTRAGKSVPRVPAGETLGTAVTLGSARWRARVPQPSLPVRAFGGMGGVAMCDHSWVKNPPTDVRPFSHLHIRSDYRTCRGGSSRAGLLGNCRITTSLRDEGRNWAMRIECPTTGGEIGQGIALLLLTAEEHRQHRRDKATAPLTLGAKTDFAP